MYQKTSKMKEEVTLETINEKLKRIERRENIQVLFMILAFVGLASLGSLIKKIK
jgi:hypothetical protein